MWRNPSRYPPGLYEKGFSMQCSLPRCSDTSSRENAVKVIFIVDEGEEVRIAKISILGTDKVNDYELKSLLQLKEDGILSDGTFNRAQYDQDKAKILAYYRHLGYLDADILEETITYDWADPEKKEVRAMYITIKVEEGERYYFDGYTLQGNELIKSSHFFQKFQMRKNRPLFLPAMHRRFSTGQDSSGTRILFLTICFFSRIVR
jgi:outer membrane protein insertion porin family